jgi:hypothetical protein
MSKKIRGNITEFGERIIKVLKDNGLVKPDGTPNYAKAERLCGLKGSYLSKAVRGDSMQEEKGEKFLSTFHVAPTWLRTGKGDQYVKNGTTVGKTPDLDKRVSGYQDEIIRLQQEKIDRLELELAECRSRLK